MTAFALASAWTSPAVPAGTSAPLRPLCAVRLIDRATGRVHRIGGCPMVIFSRDPDQVEADLLRNRAPRQWDVRVETLRDAAAALPL